MDPLRLLTRAYDLLRYGNYLAARSQSRLEQLLTDMLTALGPEPPRHRAAVRELVRRWSAMGDVAYRDLEALVERELPDLARAYRAQAGKDVGRTTAAQPNDPDVVGLPVDRWLDEQRRTLAVRAEAQLRQAMMAGEDAGATAARVRQLVAQREREAATLLRTAAVRSATAAYESGLRAAGIEQYRYVAVMDTRTTREGGWHNVGCWGANDIVFRFDDREAPRPGWHWNCRSHIEPVTGEEPVPEGFGVAEARAAGLDIKGIREAGQQLKREGRRFTPQRDPTIGAFIRSQPIGVRVEVLGAAGARRIGLGLSLAQTAQRETSTMTLEELRARL